MLYIQVKSERDPRVLAGLIASVQNKAPVDPKVALEARMVNEHQEQEQNERPSWQTLDTLNFQKLDPENDWTEL